MKVFINIPVHGGTRMAFDINENTTVSDILDDLESRVVLPPRVKVLFGGRRLERSDVLVSRCVNLGTTIHVVFDNSDHAPPHLPPTNLANEPHPDHVPSVPIVSYYHAYCRDCNAIKTARLRVRCKTCQSEAVEVVDQQCNSYLELIRTPRVVICSGVCDHTEQPASFFFKCNDDRHRQDDSPEAGTSTVVLPCVVPANSDDPIDCLSCAEAKDCYVGYECGHKICLLCWVEYLSVVVTDKSMLMNDSELGATIPCPNYPTCDQRKIDTCNLKLCRTIPEEEYARLQNFASQQWVLNEPNGFICPLAGCNDGFILPATPRGNKIDCPTCKRSFCKACSDLWHNGSCDEAQLINTTVPQHAAIEIRPDVAEQQQQQQRQRIAQNGRVAYGEEEIERMQRELEASLQSIRSTTKRCPSCKTPISKNGGCNHMTCTCGHQFCWVDMRPWDRECREAHWFPPS